MVASSTLVTFNFIKKILLLIIKSLGVLILLTSFFPTIFSWILIKDLIFAIIIGILNASPTLVYETYQMCALITSNAVTMQKNDEEGKKDYEEMAHNPNYSAERSISYNSAVSTTFTAIGAGLAAGGVKSTNTQSAAIWVGGGALFSMAAQNLNETNKNIKEKQKDWNWDHCDDFIKTNQSDAFKDDDAGLN